MDNAYDHLNKQWKATAAILLRDELGELNDYAQWLYEGNGPRAMHKSAISGKQVVYAGTVYPKNSRYIGYDEIDFDAKHEPPEPLGINDIKDIDSIIRAVSEQVAYAGNIVLGNSKFVEDSTTLNDCFYVLHSERVAFSKNIAYSTRGGYSENIFGCYGFGPVTFAIKSYAITESSRLFMASKVDFSSDCYYSHGLSGCMECMFSFNLKGRRNCIGNNVLPKDKYLELKGKLLAGITDELKRKKALPSIAEIAGKTKPDYESLNAAILRKVNNQEPKPLKIDEDKSRIEKAFSQTTKVMLGEALGPIDSYAEWLTTGSKIRLDKEKSCLSNASLLVPDYAGFLNYPRNTLLTQEEADALGETKTMHMNDIETLSLANASEKLNGIAYFSPSWQVGNLKNNIDSPMNIDSVDCYGGVLYIRSKLCAFCFSPRSCDYTFGSREGRHLSFTINCHFSTRLTRCFELDHCNNCSDCYFCHNCENVRESMFCFNTKNKMYAIANIEVGREKFLEVREKLQRYILDNLEKKHLLDMDIYSIGCWRQICEKNSKNSQMTQKPLQNGTSNK